MALGQDKQRAHTVEYEITITNFLRKNVVVVLSQFVIIIALCNTCCNL